MKQKRITEADLGQTGVNLRNGPTDRNFGERIEADVIVYTVMGKQDRLNGRDPVLDDTEDEKAEDRPEAYAKEVFKNGRTRYYVKRSTEGHLYDPFGMMQESRSKALDKQRGRAAYEFTEVTHQAFKFYVDFLRTKNRNNLSHAERAGYLT